MIDYKTVYNTRKGLTTFEDAMFIKISESNLGGEFFCISSTNFQDIATYEEGNVYELFETDVNICSSIITDCGITEYNIKKEFGFVIYDYLISKKKAEITKSIECFNKTDFFLMDKEDILNDKVKFLEKTLFSLLEII